MNSLKCIVTFLFLAGFLFQSSHALTPVLKNNYVLTAEWGIGFDTLAPLQAKTTVLTLTNLYPPPGVMIDVYLIFYKHRHKMAPVPIGFFVVKNMAARQSKMIDLFNDLHLPLEKGVVAMMAEPAGVPPTTQTIPLVNMMDGYLTENVYDVSGAPKLLANGKTGFLGSNELPGVDPFGLSDFVGNAWVLIP